MSEITSPNPYAAPTSDLQEARDDAQAPSIEQALSRGYDFRIGELLSESWQRVDGTKGIIIGGFIACFVALMLCGLVLSQAFSFVLMMSHDVTTLMVATMLLSLLITSLAYPFMAGINMIGIRRAADQPVRFSEVFAHLGRSLPLIITAIIMLVLVNLGSMLLVIPGVYLSIAYLLAIPLVVERRLSPWQALEASRKAISQHWFKVFGLFLLLCLINLVAVLPLGIGLIWSVPLFVVAMGVLYRTIFGVLPVAQ
jgi:hypothetical protein